MQMFKDGQSLYSCEFPQKKDVILLDSDEEDVQDEGKQEKGRYLDTNLDFKIPLTFRQAAHKSDTVFIEQSL